MQTNELNVLIVDDDPIEAHLVRRRLDKCPEWSPKYSHARSGAEALAWLDTEKCDVIFLDYLMGSDNGLDLLPQLIARAPRVPVLMLSGYSDPALLDEIKKAGAFGYLFKHELSTEALQSALRAALSGKASAS